MVEKIFFSIPVICPFKNLYSRGVFHPSPLRLAIQSAANLYVTDRDLIWNPPSRQGLISAAGRVLFIWRNRSMDTSKHIWEGWIVCDFVLRWGQFFPRLIWRRIDESGKAGQAGTSRQHRTTHCRTNRRILRKIAAMLSIRRKRIVKKSICRGL